MRRGTGPVFQRLAASAFVVGFLAGASVAPPVLAQDVTIAQRDYQIDAVDPGIKLFVREKMAQSNARFTNDNVVLFLHGATFPSTPDFDLRYQDYSWADRLVRDGFVVYMVDTGTTASRRARRRWTSRPGATVR